MKKGKFCCMKKIISLIVLPCLIISALCSCGLGVCIKSVTDTKSYKKYQSFYVYHYEIDKSYYQGKSYIQGSDYYDEYYHSINSFPIDGYIYSTQKLQRGDTLLVGGKYIAKVKMVEQSYEVTVEEKENGMCTITYYKPIGLSYADLDSSYVRDLYDLPKVEKIVTEVYKGFVSIEYYS